MVAPGFLADPEVRRWLDGVEPAWTMLDLASIRALRQEPSHENSALVLENNLTDAEIAASAVARNMLMLLEAAAAPNGLKLTETGNLARSVVGEFARAMDWPAFDLDVVLSVCKVVNELDIFPLHFIRRLAQLAKLVRRERGRLKTTVLGREMRTEAKRGSLQALLFHLTCWHVNLGFFDGWLRPRSWPQDDIGVLLWSLSVAAAGWQTPEKLTRLCAIPVEDVISAQPDVATRATEARVLRPLVWYGLLDQKPAEPGTPFYLPQLYRKAPLFDRSLTFNVHTEHGEAVRH